ncbi:RrF2 family transcriptional regulator [Portibacter lacus]|uniref:Transcriptional regulator n=1 Tax=Portibacter lacus TaxID=1099794 RepID=A0AA37STA6_9BACT|nr:Rrf2 family transcriptional regulator [Portibacter lacus]GLR17600.1 hypothetical protein GCM10007940_22150 [Portibacter lacus]
MFSKACEYGIKAVLYICFQSQLGNRVGLKEIAEAIDSPRAFTGKIMQQLSKNQIVQSIKGPSGGFWMEEDNRKKINIKSIVEVLDGGDIYVKCGLGLEQCNNSNPCPMHSEYTALREGLIKLHTDSSIEDLAKKLNGKATLK